MTVRNSELARTPRYDDSGDAGRDGSEASETEVPLRRRSMTRRAPTPRFVQHPHNPLSGGSLTVRNSELARTPRYDDSGDAGRDGSEASETEVPFRCRSYLLVWREWAKRLARTAGNGTHNTQKSNFWGFNTTERQPGPKWLHGGQLLLSNSYVGGCSRDYLLEVAPSKNCGKWDPQHTKV